jgi:predicted dehydrogenase
MSSDTVTRFGILGTGRVIPRSFLHPAQRTPAVEVRAVASRSRPRAELFAATHAIPDALGSYDELLEDESIDAVYVALPTALHGLWACRALERGKHVLCEKPLAVNADVAEQIARCARKNRRVVREALHLCHAETLQRAREIIAGRTLGAPLRVSAYFRHPDIPMAADDFRLSYELGGGAALDMGCYAVAAILRVMQEEPSVIAARCECVAPEVDCWMQADLQLPCGATGIIESGFRGAYTPRFEFRVECESGSLAVEGVDGLTITQGEQATRLPNPGGEVDTHQLLLADFVNEVRGAGRPLVSVSEVIAAARIIDAMYERAGLSRRRETPLRNEAEVELI